MKIKFIILLILISLFFINCSGEKETIKKKNKYSDIAQTGNIKVPTINLDIAKLYTWVNLMPGTIKKTFNITGEITVLPGAGYKFQTIKLTLIKIYQNGVFLYLISPTVRQFNNGQKGNFKKIIFSTIKGVRLIPFQKINKSITVELIFNNNGETLSYTINEVHVEKTY